MKYLFFSWPDPFRIKTLLLRILILGQNNHLHGFNKKTVLVNRT